MTQATTAATYWLENPPKHYVVLVAGKPRTDFIPIRAADGKPGIFFSAISQADRTQVQIVSAP